MKILVLQLARLGDIYQTWPVLNAIKREMPDCELHFLTRAKFATAAATVAATVAPTAAPTTVASATSPTSKLAPAAACAGGVIDRHWSLDTRSILAPLIDEKPGIDLSLDAISNFCEEIRNENFDRIVNLSFSPFSSFLTQQVAAPFSEIRGYTRFNDGYLSIPDDGSAYFYGQVGVARPNRLHVTDLFAFVAGVSLTEEDWKNSSPRHGDREPAILIHVGASDLGKTLSWSKWMQVVKGLVNSSFQGPVILIGAKDERELAAKISGFSGEKRVVNLVGETNLQEIFTMVGEASLLIGGDSGPVQMASLQGTPVLNISLPMVSFWETGPRSKGSRILRLESEDQVSAAEIVDEALAMLADRPSRLAAIRVPGPTYPYVETRPQPMAFEWELLRALYMEEPFPAPPSEIFLTGMRRLADVNRLALEQIDTLRRKNGNQTATAILDRVDEIMGQIATMVPEIAPLVRWFQTERLRIGPMPIGALIETTARIHHRFQDIIGLYVGGETAGESEHDDIVLG